MSNFKRGMGYRRDSKDDRDYKMKVSRAEIETLPPIAILNDVTPVEDQGSLGSCTGNAGDNVFKLRDSIVMGHFFNGSRLALYYWAREVDGTISEDAGSELRTMAQVLANKGVPQETDWPYIISKFTVKPPANVETDAKKSLATKYYRVDGSTPQETLINIKAAIATQYPVMFGFDVYNNFFNIDSSGDMPMGAGGIAGGHAVTVTGYDDTHTNLDGSKGALYIKNSWGTGWGNKGHFWMPYNYVLKANDHVGDAWEIIDESDFIVPPTPTPTPPPVPTPPPTPNPSNAVYSIEMTHRKTAKNTVAIWVSAKDKRGNKLVGSTIQLVDQKLVTDSSGKASFKIQG